MERIRLGDKVQVIRGREKGARGAVKKVLRGKGLVVVEGLRKATKHQKPLRQGEKGKIVQVDVPVSLANVMPIDPKTDRPTRVRFAQVGGVKQRVAKSGSALPAVVPTKKVAE